MSGPTYTHHHLDGHTTVEVMSDEMRKAMDIYIAKCNYERLLRGQPVLPVDAAFTDFYEV